MKDAHGRPVPDFVYQRLRADWIKKKGKSVNEADAEQDASATSATSTAMQGAAELEAARAIVQRSQLTQQTRITLPSTKENEFMLAHLARNQPAAPSLEFQTFIDSAPETGMIEASVTGIKGAAIAGPVQPPGSPAAPDALQAPRSCPRDGSEHTAWGPNPKGSSSTQPALPSTWLSSLSGHPLPTDAANAGTMTEMHENQPQEPSRRLPNITHDDPNASALSQSRAAARNDACSLPIPLPDLPADSCNIFDSTAECFSAGDTDASEMLIMIDRGSNVNMFTTKEALVRGQHRPESSALVRSWNSTEPTRESNGIAVALLFQNQPAPIVCTGVHEPGARRTLLAESVMWDEHRWTVLGEPYMYVMTSNDINIPLYRINGHYFVKATIALMQPPADATHAECYASSARQLGKAPTARLWAARMHVNGQGLRQLAVNTIGSGITQVDQVMHDVADSDTVRIRSSMRRNPVPDATNPYKLASRPGQRLIVDKYGKVDAPSIIDGAHYELQCVDECTDFGYAWPCRSATQSEYIAFLTHVVCCESALDHVVLTIRFDLEPTLDLAPHAAAADGALGKFKHKVEAALGVHIEFTGRGHHEGVGRQEVRNDIKQRMAEAALMRSEKPLAWLIPARVDSEWRLNRRACDRRPMTRYEHHTGIPPDLSKLIPYCFGTDVAVLEDEKERGPKGAGCHPDSVHKGRTSEGTLAGIHASTYVVKLHRGATIYPRNVKPLNEHVLLRRGMAAGTPGVEAGTQTSPPVAAAAPAASSTPVQNHFPATTQFEQDCSPDMIGPPSGRLRSRISAIAHHIETVLEASPLASIVDTFNAAAFQFAPTLAEACHCDSLTELDVCRTRLYASLQDAAATDHYDTAHAECFHLECCKASADIVTVMTDLGPQELRTPSTTKQRDNAPDAEEWCEADENALQVIIRAGNPLVSVAKPRRLGLPIGPSVLQRRYKVDLATKKLDKRKSRLCKDGGRCKAIETKLGIHQPRSAHAEAADDLEIKMFTGNAAKKRSRLLKADVGNAYCKAKKARPVSYMALGTALQRRGDDGEWLCIELHTPVYGEEYAGDEWDDTFSTDISSIGWLTSAGVRAMHYCLPPGGEQCNMLRIVDDVLIELPPGTEQVGSRTVELLNELYNGEVTHEWDPTSFAGYQLHQDKEAGTITMHMSHHVEHACRQHCPGIIDGSDLPSRRIPRGMSLQTICDGLRLVRPQPAKLSAQSKQVGSIVGSLRYPEKCIPAITLPLHRLSCVVASPPPEARLAADLVLELAYDHRYDGLTFGGVLSSPRLGAHMHASVDMTDRPAVELEGFADATWTAKMEGSMEELPPLNSLCQLDATGSEYVPMDLYSQIITYCGAAVLHRTKKLGLMCSAVQEGEQIATALLSNDMIYAREVARAIGDPQTGPTLLGSDNLANVQVAMRQGAANRSKHMLRRYYTLMRRINGGVINVVHVKDEHNPADFLTKWLPKAKLGQSISYICGINARPVGLATACISKKRGKRAA